MRIGIDLGGTKLAGIVLDANGEKICEHRLATPRGDYGNIVDAIGNLVIQLEEQAQQPCRVGIGTPGSIGPDGLLRNSNTIELNGKPLAEDLTHRCSRPLRFANDANCFALSESINGAAQGAASVFGAIIGTGTGAGIVIHQQLLTGHNAIAGEWGHNPLPWLTSEEMQQQRPCYCGKTHCIETFLSGPGLSLSYQLLSNRCLTAKAIAQLAEQGDTLARRSLATYTNQLARALSQVINIIDPEIIVLGGGLSNIKSLYDHLPAQLPDYVFANHFQSPIIPPMLGDASGVRGAALLW